MLRDFFTLITMLFELHHSNIWLTSLFSTLLTTSTSVPDEYKIQSSAYNDNFDFFTVKNMTFIKIRKRRGPKIDPCGTPHLTNRGPDS